MAIPQLKLLISLARIDGTVGEKEEKYIYNIGSANGISAEAIAPLFKTSFPLSAMFVPEKSEY